MSGGVTKATISDNGVAAVFGSYPRTVRAKLLALRKLILDTAAKTNGVGALQETLKWGQPSYLTAKSKSGTTIRIDQIRNDPTRYALYVNCQSNLIATYRDLYPRDFKFEGNRAILFDVADPLHEAALRHCIALALTYHAGKRGAR